MAKIRVGDIDIYYRIEGSGQPLVLVMGFCANTDWWPPGLVDALAAHYQVILFDNRGAGRTDAGKRLYSIPRMARDTVGLLDALGIERAHVLGVSMGGMIAQEIALRYPGRVRKLILGCTTCGAGGAFVSMDRACFWMAYLTRKNMRRRKLSTNLLFSQDFLAANHQIMKAFGRRVRIAPMPLKIQLKQAAAMLCFDTYGRLREIQAPTLVVTGTHDFMVISRNSDILAKRISGARLVKLDGCGHAFIAEAEAETARHILDFLGSSQFSVLRLV